jgi:endoglucanase
VRIVYLADVLIARLRTKTGARALRLAAAATLALVLALLGGVDALGSPATGDPTAHAAYRQHCSQRYPARRDPANPLNLPVAPGPDPLNGANFFVDGPAHGRAAGAIARLLGINPNRLSSSLSWAGFEHRLQSGRLHRRIARHPGLAHKIAELAKIAGQPEAQRFSIYSEGGGPGKIFAQAEKIFCQNMRADPGSIPIITTYFMHPALGACPSSQEIRDYNPVFHRRINEMAAATGRRPAVYLLELDAIGSSSCIARHGSMHAWEADLRYEMRKMQALAHTVVYVEAGYSDANGVRYTARILNAIGIRRIRGFYTNETHNNWTISEVRWATKISRLTHGAHFVVNTATNGRGPKRNRNRVRYGNEDLCNPPGRGLGPQDTAQTGFRYADAFLWTHPPGNSGGRCGGGPPSGDFWPARAIEMAQNANGKLGPGFPSRPY